MSILFATTMLKTKRKLDSGRRITFIKAFNKTTKEPKKTSVTTN